MVNTCLIACLTTGVCLSLPCEPPPLPAQPLQAGLPAWATPRWTHHAAGIVAGETVPNCAECDLWIACTVVGDVAERGYHPWRLRPAKTGRPGRWYGWREPRERHLTAVENALKGKCAGVPTCAFLGSLSDYTRRWRYGLASERQVLAIGNNRGAIVCIPK